MIQHRKPVASALLLTGLCAALLIILFCAHEPAWRDHLQADVSTFFARANHFLTHESWAGVGYNEYQPGALWFFVSIGLLTSAPGNFEAFLTATELVNLLLIAAHFCLILKHGNTQGAWLFLGLAVAAGPILLFRFELLVSLLTLLLWFAFQQKRYSQSGLLLGLATSIKLYPIVLLPLLLGALLYERKWTQVARTTMFFLIGLLTPVVLMLMLGGSMPEIFQGMRVHALKPIGLESFWGNLITIVQGFLGIPLRITPGYGVHGLSTDLPFLTTSFLNNMWMLPTGIITIVCLWMGRTRGWADSGFAFLVLLTFVYFSKVVNPQYLWWPLVFLPLVPTSWFEKKMRGIVWSLAIMSLLLTQVVYPLRYTEFLDWFHGSVPTPRMFVVMVVRNVLLLALLILATYGLLRLPRAKHLTKKAR